MPKKSEIPDCYLWENQKVDVITNYAECHDAISTIESEVTLHGAVAIHFNKNENDDIIRVLQLATYRGNVTLFDLDQLEQFPTVLKVLLENKDIIKVCQKNSSLSRWFIQHLSDVYNINALSMFHIRQLPHVLGDHHLSLNKLCSKYLGKKLKTFWIIENRNWGNGHLSEQQRYHATNQVRACIEVFKILQPEILSELGGFREQIDTHALQKLIDQHGVDNPTHQLITKNPEKIKTCELSGDIYKQHIIEKLNLSLTNWEVIGFDCEWDIINKKKQVGKLQLASIDGSTIIVKLSQKRILPELKKILKRDNILKVCISPERDIKKLLQLHRTKAKSFIDLRFLAKKCGHEIDTLENMCRRANFKQEIKCHAQAAIELFKEFEKSSNDKEGMIQYIVQTSSNLNKDFEQTKDKLEVHKDSVDVILDENECTRAMERIKQDCLDYKILGLDCEWRKASRIALLQLATNRGYCVLIRLCEMQKMPHALEEILQNENIIKVGKCIFGDAKKLSKQYHIEVPNVLDVGRMASICGFWNGGLGSMSAAFLNAQEYKDKKISKSNWEKTNLSEKQIEYAAKDALAGIELFNFFAEKAEMNLTFEKHNDYIQHVVDKYFHSLMKNVEKQCEIQNTDTQNKQQTESDGAETVEPSDSIKLS